MTKTDAKRYNQNKPRMSLVPSSLNRYVAFGLTYGALKYGDDNWRKGFNWKDIIDSLERHLADLKEGKDIDDESGLPNLCLMGCNLAFLIEHFDKGLGNDDRFKTTMGRLLQFREPPRTKPEAQKSSAKIAAKTANTGGARFRKNNR